MTLFRNKYRIESARLKGYDYSSPGEYFVTVCTDHHVNWFGTVIDGVVKYNDVGAIAQKMWMEIPNHYENVRLDEFIIMPNHVHGIIVIGGNEKRGGDAACGDDTACRVSTDGVRDTRGDDTARRVSTDGVRDARGGDAICGGDAACRVSTNGRASLGSIVGSYKSAVSHWCHSNGHNDFKWQTRFYDRIIRDERALNNIRKYIINNPLRWDFDRNHPSGLENMI
jgi:hypothetical protein